MKDKKILYGIIVAFVFLLSIGLTYAYFSVTTNVVGDRNDIKASVGSLSILYTDGPEIVAENIQPGWTTTKTVKVKNTGTLKSFYSIDWLSLTNEITNNELVLSATCTSDIGSCNNIEIKPVVDSELVAGVGINAGEEQTYVIMFEFKEISSAQNYNQDKKFNGVLNVIESPETFTLMGTLLDSNGNPIEGATMEVHSIVRTGVTDENGKFNITGVEVGSHEMTVKNSSDVTVATDSISLLSGEAESISGKNITGDTNQGYINLKIKLSATSTIEEINIIPTLKKKILSDNTVYADDVSSAHVLSATGIDFTDKSTLTNGQGLYTNNKLENGSNTYFRGGSFCAYTNYDIEDTSGTYCLAAGGSWFNNSCNLNHNRTTCQTQGFTYYDLKNNVTFAGHKWKIIRIDENNNIRMILADDNVNYSNFNSNYNDNAYVGYMYGTVPSTSYENAHTNTSNSTIKSSLDSWYSSNLATYSNYIADAGYCSDRSKASGSGYGNGDTYFNAETRSKPSSVASPRINISNGCSNSSRDLFTTSSSTIGNKALTYPIGLITVDEASYAGLIYYAGDTKYNFASYLRFDSWYWTMSPMEYSASVSAFNCSVTAVGNVYSSDVGTTYGLRPSTSLKPNVVVSSGTGTYDDPYVIE